MIKILDQTLYRESVSPVTENSNRDVLGARRWSLFKTRQTCLALVFLFPFYREAEASETDPSFNRVWRHRLGVSSCAGLRWITSSASNGALMTSRAPSPEVPATVATNLGLFSSTRTASARCGTVRSVTVTACFGPATFMAPSAGTGRARGQSSRFDVILGELRPDHSPVRMADGRLVESDEFFVMQMRRASNVIIAVTRTWFRPRFSLRTRWPSEDIAMDKDPADPSTRAGLPHLRNWHAAFRQVEADRDYGVDLSQHRCRPSRLFCLAAKGKKIRTSRCR